MLLVANTLAVHRQWLCWAARYCKAITILSPDVAPAQQIQRRTYPATHGVPCDCNAQYKRFALAFQVGYTSALFAYRWPIQLTIEKCIRGRCLTQRRRRFNL